MTLISPSSDIMVHLLLLVCVMCVCVCSHSCVGVCVWVMYLGMHVEARNRCLAGDSLNHFSLFLKQGLSFNRELIHSFLQAGGLTAPGSASPVLGLRKHAAAFPWMLGILAQITPWAFCPAFIFRFLQQLYYTWFPCHEIHMIQTEDTLIYPLLASNASLRCIH